MQIDRSHNQVACEEKNNNYLKRTKAKLTQPKLKELRNS